MSNLIWIILGFIGGVIVKGNQGTISNTSFAAILFCFIVACGVTWYAAYRGKSSAVATAVATAISEANAIADANAEAKASAIAQQAITVMIANGNRYNDDNELDRIITHGSDKEVIDNVANRRRAFEHSSDTSTAQISS